MPGHFRLHLTTEDPNNSEGEGWELPLPGLISWTRKVPSSVPSLDQTSRPWEPSSAVKKSRPFTTAKSAGFDPIPLVNPVPL